MEKEIWAGTGTCNVCGVNRDRYLARRRTSLTLFYVPVITFNTGRFLTSCDVCQTGAKLKRKEYKDVYSKMMQAYKDGQIPERVVEDQYNKKQLGITGKTVRVVLAWIIALAAAYVIFVGGANAVLSAMNGKLDFTYVAIALAAAVLGIPQLFSSHKRLSKAKKMLKIAKNYEEKLNAAVLTPADEMVENTAAAEMPAPAAAEVEPAAEEAVPTVAAETAEETAVTVE